MEDLTELKAQYEALGKEIEKLERGGGIWRPKEDFGYYYVGRDEGAGYAIHGGNDELYHIKFGNCFRTREEAEMYLKTKMRMIELSKPYEDGRAAWCVFRYEEGLWRKASLRMMPATVYFTEEDTQTILDEHNRGEINLDLTLGRWC